MACVCVVEWMTGWMENCFSRFCVCVFIIMKGFMLKMFPIHWTDWYKKRYDDQVSMNSHGARVMHTNNMTNWLKIDRPNVGECGKIGKIWFALCFKHLFIVFLDRTLDKARINTGYWNIKYECTMMRLCCRDFAIRNQSALHGSFTHSSIA